ncbi:MAG: hypothetical protein HEQ23_12610 [Tepidisphaera sp.]
MLVDSHVRSGIAFGCLLASSAFAQPCEPGFASGEPGESGIFDSFSAYVQPMTEYQGKLIIGGAFSAAGPLATKCVAAFDRASGQWSRLGRGVDTGNTNGYAAALATYTIDGVEHLVMGGGYFGVRNANNQLVANTTGIAAWNGTAWRSIANSANDTARSVWSLLNWEITPGRRVLLVGGGGRIGDSAANGIAYFDGETWSNIGGPSNTGIDGTFSPTVFCSAIYNGQLYIGGRFASVNGVSAPNIARWNGTVWQRPGVLGNGGAVSDVSSLRVFDNGSGARLYAGGYDIRPGGIASTVASFNGTTWSRVGQNLGGRGTSLAVFDDGGGAKLYMGMTADAQQQYFYRLEGNVWTAVDGGVSVPLTPNFPSVFGLYASGDTLYVGGNFQVAGSQGVAAYGIAAYRGCSEPDCPADFNGDAFLDFFDYADYVTCFEVGTCPAGRTADFNGDAFVDFFDYADFVQAFETGC